MRFPNHHFSSLLCAAGIGRTFWHRKVIPAQTACRETYGLMLYAGVAQSVELYRANGYAIECHWSLVRVQPSAPRPKADSVQGLKAGKPLPAGCVQICPVSRAWLREGPFDLPALNRALLRTRRRLRDESVNAGYRGECSKAGEAVSKTAWVGSIPNRPCHRRDLLPRSRTERKPAKVVFPVRCTKAAGRIIIIWLAPAMNEETDATDVPAQG